jgi:S-ribosylhomocysteine lyase
MQNILETDTIPEANIYQCGSCYMHSLEGAKKVAGHILENTIVIMDNEELKLNPENIPQNCDVDISKVKIIGK